MYVIGQSSEQERVEQCSRLFHLLYPSPVRQRERDQCEMRVRPSIRRSSTLNIAERMILTETILIYHNLFSNFLPNFTRWPVTWAGIWVITRLCEWISILSIVRCSLVFLCIVRLDICQQVHAHLTSLPLFSSCLWFAPIFEHFCARFSQVW